MKTMEQELIEDLATARGVTPGDIRAEIAEMVEGFRNCPDPQIASVWKFERESEDTITPLELLLYLIMTSDRSGHQSEEKQEKQILHHAKA